MASTHPDFPDGMEVINILPTSVYFGQRGLVYGSGPSKKNTSTAALIFVRWPSGENYKYFPSRLAAAPLKETEYRTSRNTRDGETITVHKVPAIKRPRPTLAQRLAASSKASTPRGIAAI